MRTDEVATLAGDDVLFRAQKWAIANLPPASERMVLLRPGWSRDWTGREALAYIAYRKTLDLVGGPGVPTSTRLANRVAVLIRFRAGPLDRAWYFADADSPPTFCSLRTAAELFFENGGIVLPVSVWAGLEEKVAA